MAGNDFYDDDLIRQRDRANRIKMGPGDEPSPPPRDTADDLSGRPISDLNLTRMARHKQDVDTQATRAMQELEALRKRQEQLELEKRDLEEFKRKSEEFEKGKRDVIANIKRSLTAIERDELEAQRMQELLQGTRARFKAILTNVEDIKEQTWSEENIREELTRSLGIIEDARLEYNRSMGKIDAIKSERGSGSNTGSSAPSPVLFDDHASSFDTDKGFGYWLKIGAAFSMPLIATLIVLAMVYFGLAMSGAW